MRKLAANEAGVKWNFRDKFAIPVFFTLIRSNSLVAWVSIGNGFFVVVFNPLEGGG